MSFVLLIERIKSWDGWEDPLKRRPLHELSRREAAIRRTVESPLERHRRLGEWILRLFQAEHHASE